MAVTWPAGLPQKQPLGLARGEQESLLRSQMDAGPAKVRQRYTAIGVDVDIPMLFTGAQLATFHTFWTNCWAQADPDAGTFEWKDPEDGTTATYRWRGVAKPKFKANFEGTTSAVARWSATLQLEILPSA